MMGLNLDEIISQIKEKKGLSEDDIKLKISQKRDKLSGLVSEEGAAHIIANELGIDLMESIRKHGLKIVKLKPGMRVGVTGKVLKCYEVRSFVRNEKTSKVGSFLMGDDSGLIRIVLWDDNHIAKMENGEIKPDTILKLGNGTVKENNGYMEMHLGNFSQLEINPEGVEDIKVIQRPDSSPGMDAEVKFSKLSEVSAGDNLTVYGTIVQLFERRSYEGCSECAKKVIEGKCATHPTATAKKIPILNFFLDDGNAGMRAVAFRDAAAKLLDLDDEAMQGIIGNTPAFEEIQKKVLGTQKVLSGRITSNELYNRNEFMVRDVITMDPKEVLEKIMK